MPKPTFARQSSSAGERGTEISAGLRTVYKTVLGVHPGVAEPCTAPTEGTQRAHGACSCNTSGPESEEWVALEWENPEFPKQLDKASKG